MLEKKIIRKYLKAIFSPVAKAKLIWFNSSEPKKIGQDKYDITKVALDAIDKAFDNGLSRGCRRGIDNFFKKQFSRIIKPHSKANTGDYQLGYLTVSPTNFCNLACKDCYAGFIYNKKTLPFPIVSRIYTEMKEIFGSFFMVISGGEPTYYKYKDQKSGKTFYLEDVLEKHNDTFNLMYTNGVRLADDRKFVKRIAELGNVTPAISVEGWEKTTDARRGKGMFKKIQKAQHNLNEFGIPHGISITVNRNNVEELFSDEFITEFFDKRNVLYAWSFHYMPIGKNPSFDFLLTPSQRRWLYDRVWRLIRGGYFIADFWNCGTVAGCMASGGDGGGYGYIDWNGDIHSCVFMPDMDKDDRLNNIYRLYQSGRTLRDAFYAPFHRKVREMKTKTHVGQPQNLCLPCTIRDRSSEYLQLQEKYGKYNSPTKEYREKLVKSGIMPQYNKECHKAFEEKWQDYLAS